MLLGGNEALEGGDRDEALAPRGRERSLGEADGSRVRHAARSILDVAAQCFFSAPLQASAPPARPRQRVGDSASFLSEACQLAGWHAPHLARSAFGCV